MATRLVSTPVAGRERSTADTIEAGRVIDSAGRGDDEATLPGWSHEPGPLQRRAGARLRRPRRPRRRRPVPPERDSRSGCARRAARRGGRPVRLVRRHQPDQRAEPGSRRRPPSRARPSRPAAPCGPGEPKLVAVHRGHPGGVGGRRPRERGGPGHHRVLVVLDLRQYLEDIDRAPGPCRSPGADGGQDPAVLEPPRVHHRRRRQGRRRAGAGHGSRSATRLHRPLHSTDDGRSV